MIVTVKNLFEKFKFAEIWPYLYETYCIENKDTKNTKELKKKTCEDIFNKIKSAKDGFPIKNNIIIGYEYTDILDETNKYIKTVLFYEGDIKADFRRNEKLENNYDFSKDTLDEIKEFFMNYNAVPTATFSFTPYAEIARLTIDINSLNDIGDLKFICSIMYNVLRYNLNTPVTRNMDTNIDTNMEDKESLKQVSLRVIKNTKEIYKYLKNY